MSRRLLSVLLFSIVAFSAWAPASAICAVPYLLGQNELLCDEGYCYVVTPDGEMPRAGDFWNLTFGDPDIGEGTDNGTYGVREWCLEDPHGCWMIGGWAEYPGGQDGCAANQIPPGKSGEITVVALGTEYAGNGYAAIAAVEFVGRQAYVFDFANLRQDIVLQPIPEPELLSADTRRSELRVQIASPSSPPALTDGAATVAELVPGYRVYGQWRGRREPAPDTRDRGAWVAMTDVVPLGGVAEVVQRCEQGQVLYLATAWAYDSGYESAFVSRNSAPIPCGWQAIPKEHDFRFIERGSGARIRPR
jgi:hypothetical protein